MTHEQKALRRKEVADRVKTGVPPSLVANEYGVSLSYVHAACAGTDRRLPNGVKIFQIVAKLITTDKTLIEIANEVQVSYQYVQEIRNQLSEQGVNFEEIHSNN